MIESVLYYPYISLPENSWSAKSLLYWDKVYSIIPKEQVKALQRSEGFMSDLIDSDSFEALIPDPDETYDRNQFDREILDFVNGPDFNIQDFNVSEGNKNLTKLYTKKFNHDLMYRLSQMDLAIPFGDSYLVEQALADIMMFHLANTLKGNSINSDEKFELSTDQEFHSHGDFNAQENHQIENARQAFLDEILPFPLNPDFQKLLKFKEKYYDDLLKFRRKIELFSEALARYPEDEDRFIMKQKFEEELQSKRDEVVAKMPVGNSVERFVVGAAPGVGTSALGIMITGNPLGLIPGFLGAFYGGIKKVIRDDSKGHELRYVALLDKKFS